MLENTKIRSSINRQTGNIKTHDVVHSWIVFPLSMHLFCNEKSGFIRGVASLEKNNSVAFY
jgi:hypothetical protein